MGHPFFSLVLYIFLITSVTEQIHLPRGTGRTVSILIQDHKLRKCPCLWSPWSSNLHFAQTVAQNNLALFAHFAQASFLFLFEQATDLWSSELGHTLQRIDRDLGRQVYLIWYINIMIWWYFVPKKTNSKRGSFIGRLTHITCKTLFTSLEIWLCWCVLFLVCSSKKLLPAAKSAHGFDGFDRPIYILHKTVNHGREMFAK